MGGFSGNRLVYVVAACVLNLGLLTGCAKHTAVSGSPLPAKINLIPGGSASLQLGSTLRFTATAQNSANAPLNALTFAFQSSNTALLNFAPNGQACAGVWSSSFTVCVPGSAGVVEVTASADGVVSTPTLVFLHPPIDNIVLNQMPPSPPVVSPVPCLSQGQTVTLTATAYSGGIDVTPSVGPFQFNVVNNTVATISPLTTNVLVNGTTYQVFTNQATATANAPGFTQIFATSSGVTSTPYQQFNNNGPVWNFFETCPVQTIVLQLGTAGGQQSGLTTFSTAKGTSKTLNAMVYDVAGNIMSKPPLSWTTTQPTSIGVPSSCATLASCTVSTPGPGSGIVTASCTPPTCNIGFPLVPANVSQLPDAQLYIPVPVYAATAVSGVVTGTPSATAVIASSTDCAANFDCSVSLYDISTATNLPGSPVGFPMPPNSLVFDPAGDKAYVGGNYGVFTLNASNLGTANNPFGGLGSFTGKALAVSLNGQLAVFSDTVHNPNQVFITNSSNPNSPLVNNYAISGAVAAAFSPDSTKALILACIPGAVTCSGSAGNTLYVYSTLQAMQTIPLSAPASGVAFSSTGAFAFVNGGSAGSSITTFSTCNNALSTPPPPNPQNPFVINLPAQPQFLQVLPAAGAPSPIVNALQTLTGASPLNAPGLDVIVALDSTGIDLIATQASVLQLTSPPSDLLCPQYINNAVNQSTTVAFVPEHINFGVGTFHPIAFFVYPDGSRAFVVTTDFSSVLVYNFNTGSVSGSIPLAGNAIPISASFTQDGTLVYVAANDGTVHEVNTLGASDVQEITFPDLVNVNNPFCAYGSTTIACTLDLLDVRP